MVSFILEFIGTLTVAAAAYQVYKFVDLYFLKNSTLPRYLHAKGRSYALVTGSSDGIGLETAKELHKRGFNIILHGRNPEKLLNVAKKMNEDYPSQKVVTVAASADDAANSVPKIVKAVEEVEKAGGKLTVLINNVGGMSLPGVPTYAALKDIPQESISKQLDMNAQFPTLLTAALMPKLIANAPGLVINIGSYAGVYGMPYISIYSSSKAFNLMFSEALFLEMKMLKADVEVLGIIVGNVKTPGNPDTELGFMNLAPEEMARSILERVGCGQAVAVGNWKQCFGAGGMGWLPVGLRGKILMKEIQQRKDQESKKA
jgi:17beta-estradiol 17-dehydrogenase / very-long-chain 3-oxoacyl-CoA reductase